MAATPTYQIPLGFPAPDFYLPEPLTGRWLRFKDIKGEKGTVVIFMCNHCPYVLHILDKLLEVARQYKAQGIGFVGISSNDVASYPEDAPEKMAALARDKNFSFPYLYDESQAVAKAYFAACTPDISVFDAHNLCVYRGQFDASRPKNDLPPDGADLRHVLDNLIAGEPVPSEQTPSIGCNIKWKPGSEPYYY
jgi:thiol-disulfide isomerase/thioredoxin